MVTFKAAGFVLCALGLVVWLIGGAGIPDGIGGVAPHEGGARLVGGAMLVLGVVCLGVHLAQHRGDNNTRPPGPLP